MGLFSTDDKITVGTTVMRVLEDEALPNSLLSGMSKSMLAGDGQMVNNVMEDLGAGIGMRCNRMYEYAKKSYTHGLPSGRINTSHAGRGDITNIIKNQHPGFNVTLKYFNFGPINNLHYGWHKLVNDHGYVQSTNILTGLTTAKGTDVFLKDMVVVVTNATVEEQENGSLDLWDLPPNFGPTPSRPRIPFYGSLRKPVPFEVSSTASDDYLRVEYSWIETTTVIVAGEPVQKKEIKEDSFIISMAGFDRSGDYYQVKYTYNSNVGYFMYKAGSGLYPDLDAIYTTVPDGLGSFFPFAYFRYNKAPVDANKNSADYLTSKKLMKYIGIDYQEMIDSINENPDIADVEQAMLMMAVPAMTANPYEQRYLFDFFNAIYTASGSAAYPNSPIGQYLASLNGTEIPEKNLIIQDKLFKMGLHFKTILKRKVSGSIGKKGSYSSERTTITIERTGLNHETREDSPWVSYEDAHVYRKQISESSYEEVQVVGLRMTYHIWGEYTTTGDEEDKILLIPLDRSITKKYSVPFREVLYARSLHYVFNSRIVTKVKWYQTGIFKAILVIVAIIITIYTYGKTWKLIAASLAAGTITIGAVVSAFVIGLFKYMAIQIGIKLFVKAVGVKAALIVALVAALVYGISAISTESLNGAPWAKDLLQLSTSLTSNINEVMKAEFQDLIGETESFAKYVEEQTKLLDDAKNLLSNNNILNPLTIFGETPSEYYQRTVHSGNIGVLGIEAISSYVDVALALPKLADTI